MFIFIVASLKVFISPSHALMFLFEIPMRILRSCLALGIKNQRELFYKGFRYFACTTA